MLHHSPRGTANCFCSRKEEASDASKGECCFNSFRKACCTPPRALRLQSSSWTREDKQFAMQFLSCFCWFYGRGLPAPGAKSTRFLYAMPPVMGRIWLYSAYRDSFLGNLKLPLLPLWEVIRHAELICLLPICLFNPFMRHVAKAPQY